MKRIFLFMMLCVLATIGVRAVSVSFGTNGSTWEVIDGTLVFNVASPGDLKTLETDWWGKYYPDPSNPYYYIEQVVLPDEAKSVTKVKFVTPAGVSLNTDDMKFCKYFPNTVAAYDFTNAVIADDALSSFDLGYDKDVNVFVPKDVEDVSSFITGITNSGVNGYKFGNFYQIKGTSANLYIYNNDAITSTMFSADNIGDATDIVISNWSNGTVNINTNLKNSINAIPELSNDNRRNSLTIINGKITDGDWAYSGTHILNLDLTGLDANSNSLTFNSGGTPATTQLNTVTLTDATNIKNINLANEENLTSLNLTGATFTAATNTVTVHDPVPTDLTINVTDPENLGFVLIPSGASENVKGPRVNPYTYSNFDLKLHEADDEDHLVYWYKENDNYVNENSVVTINMSDGMQGTLSDILSEALVADKYDKVKITGPVSDEDIDALSAINATILDLSEATLQRKDGTTYVADNTILKTQYTGTTPTVINSNVKFLVLTDGATQAELVNEKDLAGFPALYSAVEEHVVTENGVKNRSITSYTKVAGTLQAGVVAAAPNFGGGSTNFKRSITIDGTKKEVFCSYPTLNEGATMRYATIAGELNGYDIANGGVKVNADGHFEWDTPADELNNGNDTRTLVGDAVYGGFSGTTQLQQLDMEKAVFRQNSDMTVSASGANIIAAETWKVVIPTSPLVTETPAYFITTNGVKEICIPSNIEIIRTHFAPSVDHIWTTAHEGDVDGTVYDNGMYEEFGGTPHYGYSGLVPTKSNTTHGTYTFSSNLKMIESNALANSDAHVSDVYVLAETAPECHVDAFNIAMYIGFSGYGVTPDAEQGIVTRDKFQNNNNLWITMLHFPRNCGTPDVQRYTDPTREYSIATGMTDGKGATIYFPNAAEFLRAYLQGTTGYTWNAWNTERNGINGFTYSPTQSTNTGWTQSLQETCNEGFINNPDKADNPYTSFYDVTANGAFSQPTGLEYYYNVYWDERELSAASPGNLYPQATTTDSKDYRGWHQFVLTGYSANTTDIVTMYRSYITDDDWWTICLPYDLTYNEMMLFYGDLKKTSVTVNGETKLVPRGEYDDTKKPYLSMLMNVVRDVKDLTITLNFSKNLMTYKHTQNADGSWTVSDDELSDEDKQAGSDYVVLHKGVPYMIRPCFPASNANRQFDIYGKDQATNQAVEVNEQLSDWRVAVTEDNYPGLYEKLMEAKELDGTVLRKLQEDGLYTVPALIANKDAKSDKISADEISVSSKTVTYDGTTYPVSDKHDYTFVGAFFNNVLPPNGYFLGWQGRARFFYNDNKFVKEDDNTNDEIFRGYNWNNHTGVIVPNMLASSVTKTTLSNAEVSIPNNLGLGSHDGKVTLASGSGSDLKPARWCIFETSNDWFGANSTGAKSVSMVFGVEMEDKTAGVEEIAIEEKELRNSKVFTVDGQYVGTSIGGLSRGLYIQNGKKVVVK